MSEAELTTLLEICMHKQYCFGVTGEGVRMSNEQQLFQSALDVIVDGVTVSAAQEGREEAGREIFGTHTKKGSL